MFIQLNANAKLERYFPFFMSKFFQLASAVQQLVNESKRVLVLGRRHMNTWPRMDYIRSIAPVFLVEDM